MASRPGERLERAAFDGGPDLGYLAPVMGGTDKIAAGPWGWRLACLATVALAVAHLLYYGPRTVDDMFIFLRYAENFAAGDGLVYNVGERVEGYSSPLWVFALAGAEVFGFDGVSFAKLLGLGCFLALGLGVYRLGRDLLALGPWPALFGCAFLALNSYVVAWTLLGLETPLYLALMVWLAVLAQRVTRPTTKEPRSRDVVALSVVAALFVLARPEAPLFAAFIAAGVLLPADSREELWARVRRARWPALAAVTSWVALLLVRRAYFGLWFPHTAYAKPGGGFGWFRLWPLLSDGASVFEIALVVAGLVGAVHWWRRRRGSLVPALVALCTGLFTGLVLLDWMPNLRHFLPLWVFLPCAVIALAVELRGDEAPRRRRLGAALLVLVAAAGLRIAAVDSRYSPMDFVSHGRGESWVRWKSEQTLIDTWACLNRETPDHIARMGPGEHGMITQLYRILEADEGDLEERWYVARDIGRVGWLAPIRVFDVDGLFTPDVITDPDWQQYAVMGADGWRLALARDVIMSDGIEDPARVVLEDEALDDRYDWMDAGGGWGGFLTKDRTPPGRTLVLARYEHAVSKMPEGYYLMTLYGEAVGAALERRLEVVRANYREPD